MQQREIVIRAQPCGVTVRGENALEGERVAMAQARDHHPAHVAVDAQAIEPRHRLGGIGGLLQRGYRDLRTERFLEQVKAKDLVIDAATLRNRNLQEEMIGKDKTIKLLASPDTLMIR